MLRNAESAPLIGKRMKEDDATAVFQAMYGSGAYIPIRFGGGLPTLPDPVPDVSNKRLSQSFDVRGRQCRTPGEAL